MDAKQEEAAADQAERFESIPWADLVPDADPRLKKALMIGGMIVVGAAIGLLGGGLIRGTQQSGVVVTLPPIASAATVAVEPVPVVETPADTVPTVVTRTAASETAAPQSAAATPLPPQLYSEADLMAVLPEEEMRLAVMRAEWFVTDFFTVDGDASGGADVLAALPNGTEVPLPHASADGGISYVEWARAYRVEPLGPAQYRVAVAYRTLAGPAIGDLTRMPPAAVSVDVEVGVDGSTGVLDLPSPLDAPGTLVTARSEAQEAEAPADVLGAALAAAGAVGTDPAAFRAGLDQDGWRVVVLVGNASGLRWPLAVRR